MKIACIGWGSLIWNPRRLKTQNKWFEDGPFLPIEFTRISRDDRVTLIIDEKSKPVRTLWTLMTTESLDEGLKSLKDREGCKKEEDIHHVTSYDEPKGNIQETIKKWILEKNLDAAVWTGLSYNKERPDIDRIIEHLDKLERKIQILAEEYIRKAPKQIDTEYRRRIEKEFGWTLIE